MTTVSDSTAGGRRTLSLTVTPKRAVRLIYLGVEGAGRFISATVDGRVSVGANGLGDAFGVLFHAPPATGLPVTL